jgi:hypothetical protein
MILEKALKDILLRIIAERSFGVLDNVPVCRALLMDYAKDGALVNQIRLLMELLEAGFHTALVSCGDDLASCKLTLIRRLEEEYFIDHEFSKALICLLCEVLRKDELSEEPPPFFEDSQQPFSNHLCYLRDHVLVNDPLELSIHYCDVAGNQTQREIVPQIIGKNNSGEMYIQAFCRLRDDIRVFKLSGIIALNQTPQEYFEQLYNVLRPV